MVVVRPFAMYWEDSPDGVVVNVRGRDTTGRHRAVRLYGTEPCFWVLADVKVPPHWAITRVEPEPIPGFYGEKLQRITVRLPSHVKELRETFADVWKGETWQADVYYHRKIRYDYGIKNAIEIPDDKLVIQPADIKPVDDVKILPRVCVYDIETYDKNGYSSPEEPTQPIVSIAMWDSFLDRYVCIFKGDPSKSEREHYLRYCQEQGWNVDVYCVETEKELLEIFAKYCEQVAPDYLVAWNGQAFDDLYTQGRMRRNNVYMDWRKFGLFDLMLGYSKLHKARHGELEEEGLDFVATQIFKMEGKNNDGEKIWHMMENSPGKLITYNLRDVFLTKEIMLQSNAIEFFANVAARAGIELSECLHETRILDGFMFHMLRGERIQPTSREKQFVRIQGGDVFTRPGIYDHVFEVDNSAEYPSIGRTWNFSPETLVRPEDYHKYPMEDTYNMPTGRRYLKDEDGKYARGYFPRMWDALIKDRDELKAQKRKMEELAVKVIMNAGYGGLKNQWYRLGNPYIAEDITFMGREHLYWNKDIAEADGAVNTIRDTDSFQGYYPGLPKEQVKPRVDALVVKMNASYIDLARKYGANRHFLQVKAEPYIYLAQTVAEDKMYACLYEDPDGEIERDGIRYAMKVRGFALRKSSSAPVTKVVQRAALEKVLFREPNEHIERYIVEMVQKVRTGAIPVTECRIPTKIGKDFSAYKVKGPHVKAAEWSNKHLGKRYGEGSKPCYYFGHIKGKPYTEVFSLDWNDKMPPNAIIDYAATIERVLLMPLDSVLKGTGINPYDAAQGRRQQTLP